MKKLTYTLALLLAGTMGAPALAQDTTTPDTNANPPTETEVEVEGDAGEQEYEYEYEIREDQDPAKSGTEDPAAGEQEFGGDQQFEDQQFEDQQFEDQEFDRQGDTETWPSDTGTADTGTATQPAEGEDPQAEVEKQAIFASVLWALADAEKQAGDLEDAEITRVELVDLQQELGDKRLEIVKAVKDMKHEELVKLHEAIQKNQTIQTELQNRQIPHDQVVAVHIGEEDEAFVYYLQPKSETGGAKSGEMEPGQEPRFQDDTQTWPQGESEFESDTEIQGETGIEGETEIQGETEVETETDFEGETEVETEGKLEGGNQPKSGEFEGDYEGEGKVEIQDTQEIQTESGDDEWNRDDTMGDE